MKKILVVEDEAPLREELVDTLIFQDFDVIQAPNGMDGLRLAKEQLPDLIISDIAMPQLDGYGLLQGLREDTRTASIPLIFLTARAERSAMRHGMELGADDYLTKPFTHEELLSAVNARFQRQTEVTPASAQELEQAKQTLFSMVSHELRTPLASITMVQDIIERQLDQLDSQNLHDLLETLHHGSHRLRHLVEQVVFVTQFETGGMKEEILQKGSPVQSWAVLTGAVSLAREFVYRNRDGIVHVDDRDRDSLVHCYLPALKHALAELIANALSFSPADREVTISQWLADDWLWISIVDQGCGMSPDQVKQALIEFQQIDRRGREQQGMGLGLPLARRIIEAHRGGLELKSVVGKGTQALVRLPLGKVTGKV
jgi:two-component system sensor histidine kinase/response regulator